MSTSTPSLSSYRQAARSLGAKSTGALALGAGLLAASEARAGIVFSTFTSNNVSHAGVSEYLWLDVLSNPMQVSNASPGSAQGYVWTTGHISYVRYRGAPEQLGNIGSIAFNVGDHVSQTYVTPLTAGTPINGGNFEFRGLFKAYDATYGSLWDSVTAYVGFRIAVVGGYNYGWMKFTSDHASRIITLDAIALNNEVNGAITAGQTTPVPEPATSAALLALGAAGLVAYRRRKNLQRAAA